jgi:hypothetical protein
MVIGIRPERGGFVRAFGCGIFIRDFLLGRGPEGSKKIDPSEGAPQTDVFDEYKSALLRSFARDSVERLEEARIKAGKPAFTEVEYEEHLSYFLERIPRKFTRMRYSSFCCYFGHLQRLKWVEKSGKIEVSAFQEKYPPAPSRVFYRLTDAGRAASDAEWSNPVVTLYPDLFGLEYYREKNKKHRYYKQPKKG